MGQILKYCENKGITMDEFSEITGVSVPQLYLINGNDLYNVTISTVNKIFVGTLNKFGVGLSASEYLGHDCFKKHKR